MADESNWDDYQGESGSTVDESGVSLSGEMYVQESRTIEGGTSIERQEAGGSLTVDYPDSWGPADDADSSVTVSGEIHHEDATTIEDGTATDTSSWGGEASLDY
ncbi:hypothetical protein [Streptomyces sp. NPDC059874]|uniref:hypothetical protein n=1 Tax=Streptomyces sp. NPDC059874 TaxID=3346983 RepID=UPI003667537E